MVDPVKIERLRTAEGEDFRQVYGIYTASIVAREQKPEGWIAGMVQRADYRVCFAKTDGVVRGFGILFLPPNESFALLEYMAVAAEQREQGIGGKLFRWSVDHAMTPQRRKVPVLLEIDSDREASVDRAIRTRREGFYRRLGCVKIAPLRYIMPLPGEGPPPEMDLMVYSEPPLEHLALSTLQHWLQTIYREVYRCPPDDPRIARMLRDLPDPVVVE